MLMITICRYGEIFLKGNNRSEFERVLMKNIYLFMKKHGVMGTVYRLRNRILIDSEQRCDFLRFVFGIVSFSSSICVDAALSAISTAALSLLEERSFTTFAVAGQRLTKDASFTSRDINMFVGDAICATFGVRVCLGNPDIRVGVEIIDKYAYVFVDNISGPGGLPVGVSGRVAIYFDRAEAEAAALLMLKRGCDVVGLGIQKPELLMLSDYLPVPFSFSSASGLSDVCSWCAKNCIPLALGVHELEDISLNSDFSIPFFYPLIGLDKQVICDILYHQICTFRRNKEHEHLYRTHVGKEKHTL